MLMGESQRDLKCISARYISLSLSYSFKAKMFMLNSYLVPLILVDVLQFCNPYSLLLKWQMIVQKPHIYDYYPAAFI